MNTLGPIDPEETKLLTFNFTRELEGASIAAVSLTCSAIGGTDAAAQSRLAGLPVLTQSTCTQRLSGCLAGVVYKVRAKAVDTAGLEHVLPAVLACVRL